MDYVYYLAFYINKMVVVGNDRSNIRHIVRRTLQTIEIVRNPYYCCVHSFYYSVVQIITSIHVISVFAISCTNGIYNFFVKMDYLTHFKMLVNEIETVPALITIGIINLAITNDIHVNWFNVSKLITVKLISYVIAIICMGIYADSY